MKNLKHMVVAVGSAIVLAALTLGLILAHNHHNTPEMPTTETSSYTQAQMCKIVDFCELNCICVYGMISLSKTQRM